MTKNQERFMMKQMIGWSRFSKIMIALPFLACKFLFFFGRRREKVYGYSSNRNWTRNDKNDGNIKK